MLKYIFFFFLDKNKKQAQLLISDKHHWSALRGHRTQRDSVSWSVIYHWSALRGWTASGTGVTVRVGFHVAAEATPFMQTPMAARDCRQNSDVTDKLVRPLVSGWRGLSRTLTVSQPHCGNLPLHCTGWRRKQPS